jgi:hypothetical protein
MFGIKKKFIIVLQNSDKEFNEGSLALLLPYAIHIYSINCVIQHPMCTTIPIGFGDWSLDIIPKIPITNEERTIDIFAAFLIGTNTRVRQPCHDSMVKNTLAIVRHFSDRSEFYRTLNRVKYVVCPEGEGHDTHRIYESIYFGAVPIVLKPSVLAHLYKDMPIKWVDSWDNLELDWETDKNRLDAWVSKNINWHSQLLIKDGLSKT